MRIHAQVLFPPSESPRAMLLSAVPGTCHYLHRTSVEALDCSVPPLLSPFVLTPDYCTCSHQRLYKQYVAGVPYKNMMCKSSDLAAPIRAYSIFEAEIPFQALLPGPVWSDWHSQTHGLPSPPPPFAFAEEHTARVKAEAAEEHAVRRLTVAQEQLVEYAQQQAADTAAVLAEAQSLETLLASTAAGRSSGPSSAPPAASAAERADSAAGGGAAEAEDTRSGGGSGDGQGAVAQLRSCMASLRQRLLNIAGEADIFAAQQKADLARSKRSLSQARPSKLLKCHC